MTRQGIKPSRTEEELAMARMNPEGQPYWSKRTEKVVSIVVGEEKRSAYRPTLAS